jgi:hypothetical protein
VAGYEGYVEHGVNGWVADAPGLAMGRRGHAPPHCSVRTCPYPLTIVPLPYRPLRSLRGSLRPEDLATVANNDMLLRLLRKGAAEEAHRFQLPYPRPELRTIAAFLRDRMRLLQLDTAPDTRHLYTHVDAATRELDGCTGPEVPLCLPSGPWVCGPVRRCEGGHLASQVTDPLSNAQRP